jgi:hypothetical protein
MEQQQTKEKRDEFRQWFKLAYLFSSMTREMRGSASDSSSLGGTSFIS